MQEMSSEAERAGLLSATQALMVGLLSTLRRKGVLTQQDLDHLFEAGLLTFETGEPDDSKAAARLTLEIISRSLSN
jgi:hypothetical protein